jgi:hypothetical protein
MATESTEKHGKNECPSEFFSVFFRGYKKNTGTQLNLSASVITGSKAYWQAVGLGPVL